MVLFKKKYSLFFLFLFINQIKFFNSFDPQFGEGENSTSISTGLISNSTDFEDIIFGIEEKYEEENEEEKEKEEEVNKEEEEEKEEEVGKEENREVEEEEENEKKEEEEEEEENEKEEEEEDQQKKEDEKKEPIPKIDSTEEISPFDKYDNCENIQPTYGIKEDCINYKIFNEQSCCYMTINYKYNDFNVCIRISKDKDEIKKKIKEIKEEYEGCKSVTIDCHSNYIELQKIILTLIVFFTNIFIL